jgi:hypothetical protein
MTTTLNKWGVPLGGGSGRGGIIQPKVKNKFRVRFINFGPMQGGLDITQNIQTITYPKYSAPAQEVHIYNSIAYYPGKQKWEPIDCKVLDDVTNTVNKLVGYQMTKQHNFFEQTTPLAGSQVKFDTYIETLDGGNDTIIDQWHLEGCFLTDVDFGDLDYASEGEKRVISFNIRFDAAHQDMNMMPIAPYIGPGILI